MENQSTELCVCIVHCVPTFHWAGRICCGCSRSSPDQRSSSPLELFSPENSSLFNIHTMPQNIQDLFKPLDISALTSFGKRNTFTAHIWPQHKTTPKRNMSRHGLSPWPLASVASSPPNDTQEDGACRWCVEVHMFIMFTICNYAAHNECADSRWVSGLFNPTATIAFICV